MAKSIDEISKFLKEIKFKKKMFGGGVDEFDVWSKIEKLNNEYKELYELQKMKISLLEEQLNEK